MENEKMDAILATRNAFKTRELNALFAANGVDANLITLDEAGFTEEIEENGASFEENALIKARSAAKALGRTAVADDSGLEVDALDGAPGIYSARYAGTGKDGDNNALLLRNLEGVPEQKRTARFVCAMAVVFPDGKEIVVRGECEGVITTAPRGSGKFGYDPLFYYPPMNATFAELEGEIKNGVSHRANAVKKLCEELKKTR